MIARPSRDRGRRVLLGWAWEGERISRGSANETNKNTLIRCLRECKECRVLLFRLELTDDIERYILLHLYVIRMNYVTRWVTLFANRCH